ncbi:MAG: hypothetical protein PPHEMADM_1505 [uncultured Paraburkholderia sp.]|nr:MAG: hypothetical protein PPHEMADE_1485 [uncultured Paraburkholderia sp.]CAH2915895.1 MAG: hypothetical protein PPHEMADM_1505 [uncultured Paraburkholderia sp.]
MYAPPPVVYAPQPVYGYGYRDDYYRDRRWHHDHGRLAAGTSITGAAGRSSARQAGVVSTFGASALRSFRALHPANTAAPHSRYSVVC